MDLASVRPSYNERDNLFLEEHIEVKDPIKLFEKWMNVIKNDPTIIEPNAMCLSTATKNGIPSARFVLLKGFGNDGFKFFTHYTSRKGQELEENPNAALTFYWQNYSRSVRIEGTVEKLPFSDADEYFSGRPYQSQIGALVSNQSFPIESRDVLSQKEKELKQQYKEKEVPRPPQWGGYIVKPKTIEFWQGQTDRIHDRIKFVKSTESVPEGSYMHAGENGWNYQRLCP